MKKLFVRGFFEFLGTPLIASSRLILVALAAVLVLGISQPLWRISMVAPQYRNGLTMDIYAYKVEGGREGRDLAEINVLNHYIGMRKIERATLTDLDWLPFALGALFIFALRVAAIGNIRSLVDLVVLTSYTSAFAFARFVYQMYVFGHDLDPDAPMKATPFTPAILGSKQVANFTTHSYPALGSVLVGVFVTGIIATLGWHLISGWKKASTQASTPPLSSL